MKNLLAELCRHVKRLTRVADVVGLEAAAEGDAALLDGGAVAVEVLVVGPVEVAPVVDAAALELLLHQVDQVLEVEVVAVALDQLLREVLLQEVGHLQDGEGADLATTEVATTSPPEIATTRTYIHQI